MKKLIMLKNVLARQLPKMPKEYIVRLLFDNNHESICVREASEQKMIGGICYSLFPQVKLSEIVFLAISSEYQIKGFGTLLMNIYKNWMQKKGIEFIVTCADNLAVGYFLKQGFHKEITIPTPLYKGYFKDYLGSTKMCHILHPTLNYESIHKQIQRQYSNLKKIVRERVDSKRIYKGLPKSFFSDPKNTRFSNFIDKVPGLREAGYTKKEYEQLLLLPKGNSFWGGCMKVVEQLKDCKESWPFLKPVKKEEVPDYYQVISHPMDFQTIENKIKSRSYPSKAHFRRDVLLIFQNAK